MASTLKHHHELTNGVGKCSVPMWQGGCPAGFCDELAYGNRPDGQQYRNARTGEMMRLDGRYNGYVPGLACPGHGGPDKPVRKITYDAKCEELAVHFLQDEPKLQYRKDELARHIQQAIEDWLDDETNRLLRLK